ncbi:MAG: hypothetical protein K0R73_1143 [Candidatus Midichloriaceae bacterium]|jgi:hypothetical protein|nr:hypothetical protein [Candidatus Midichloriaceae bacterium]
MVITEKLFSEGSLLERKLSELHGSISNNGLVYQPSLRITPSHIGFNKPEFDEFDLYDYDPYENYEEMLSNIPFISIKNLLLEIAKNSPDDVMNIIRKFPTSIQQELDKYNVKYCPDLPIYLDKDSGKDLKIHNEKFNDWSNKNGLILSNHTADSHIFEAECYKIYVNIECHVEKNQFNN